MLRDFRWQLLALLAAVSLFIVSLIARPDTEEAPTVTATPNIIVDVPTTDFSPSPTPEDVQNADIPTVTSPDGILTYREALVGDVQRLNPLLVSLNPVDRDITSLIFEGLTRITPYGEVVPALAKEWVVSFDQLEYVVILREDVLWQDGVPFTADDVIYTMSLLSSPDFPGSPELGDFWRTVETQKIDDHLVRFRLAQPLGTFPEALRVGILPYHAMQGTSAAQLVSHPFNLSPIGTGPYQLETLRMNGDGVSTVDLRVAPVFRQRPEGQSGYAIERLRFQLYDSFDGVLQALRAGEVDAYATRNRSERLPLLEMDDRIVPHTSHEPAVGMLIFNWVDDNVRFFREERVRLALATALDRESIIQWSMLNLAVPADSPIPRHSWAYDSSVNWSAYNLETARNLLETAGLNRLMAETSDVEGEETPEVEPASDALLSFSILTVDDPALVSAAQRAAEQWAILNIDVTVEAVDLETYLERLQASDFDTAIIELSNEGSADPDVYSFWHQSQYPEGQNYGGANDRTISEALERARRETNGTNRAIYYRQFQQAFIREAIAIPLYYPLFTYAVVPEVQGVQLGYIGTPADRFLTIKDWRF